MPSALLPISLLVAAAPIEVDAEWLAATTTLADDRAPASTRVQAAGVLVEAADERAIPVLRAAVRGREDAVRQGVLEHLESWPHAAVVALLDEAVHDELASQAARATAIRSLGGVGLPSAGHALYVAAGNRSVPAALRRLALTELEAGFPELLAERGPPRTVTDPVGATAGVIGNGVAGGILMSSVGVWGRTDTGVVVGAAGGGVIGAGTAGLYAGLRPLERGQGLLYASNVGWGLTGGVLLSHATFGRSGTPPAGDETKANVSALYRSAGVATGAAIALSRFDEGPTSEDVLSLDTGGWLGTQLALGIADLTEVDEPDDCWLPYDRPPTDAERCWNDTIIGNEQRRSAFGLGGLALGLGTAIAAQDAWQPTWQSGLFATAVGAEAGWIGGWLPTALGNDDPDGNVRTALHAGAAGALLLDHHLPRSPDSSVQVLYGGLVGNSLGAGIPMLFDAPEQTQVGVMLPVGAAGSIAGGFLGDRIELSGGDLSMMGVGTSLAVAEASTIGFILDENGVFTGDYQRTGLTLTAGGLAGLGFEALATRTDPDVGDMLFLGSAGAWGATYGVLTPIALDTDGTEADLALVTLLTADAFIAAGGVLVSPAVVELSARDTLLPQVCGVGGATLGTLGVSFASDEPPHLATGALVGTTVGFVGGGLLRAALPRRTASTWQPPVPTALARLRGDWRMGLSPTVLDDGTSGVTARLDVIGW